MSNPEINQPSAAWHERITTPFRVLFQDGFLATWHNHTLFSLVSLSLLALVIVSGVWWFGLRDASSPEDPSIANADTPVPADPSDIAEQLQADEEQWTRIQEEGQRQEEIAVARYRLLCVRQKADHTKDIIDDCLDEAVAWTDEISDFEAASIDWSDPSNRALLGRVDMLFSLDTPEKLALDGLLDRFSVLAAPLKQAELSGEAAPVSSDLESSIIELGTTAWNEKKLLQRRRAMLASIRMEATTSSREDLPPFTVALETYRAELAAEQQERIDGQLSEARAESEAALLEVEQEAAAALAEAKRQAAETMGRIEVEKAEAEAWRAEQLEEVADAEAQLAADRAKLEREFEMDLPKIKHLLQAFITPDNHHPLKNKTAEKVPYSFSFLESRGVLDPTDDSMKKFCYLATLETGERPLGPIPYVDEEGDWYNKVTETQVEVVVTAQELLRKYGLLMVEKKMLLP